MMLKIAEKYTYERIKRVINGYKNGKKDVPGIKGNLKYFKLHPLPRTDGMKSLTFWQILFVLKMILL